MDAANCKAVARDMQGCKRVGSGSQWSTRSVKQQKNKNSVIKIYDMMI